MLPKVLVVEDEFRHQRSWKDSLHGKVEIMSAYTIEEAEGLFFANVDVALIVMDACVPGDDPTTPPLVQKMRETFFGPIIAASSDWGYRQELMAAGCDHECPKHAVPQTVVRILNLS